MQGQATYIALVYVSTRCWQILRLPYQGWEKPVFFKKKQPTNFFVFFFKKRYFFGFFKKQQDFVLFSKKTEKPHSELFLFHHAISLFSELHNNLLYLLCHQHWGWSNVPHLWFCNVLLVSSLLNDKAWQACAYQTQKNHYHTNSAVSHQVYVHALLVQHLQSVFFQYMIWYVPKSEKVQI